MFLFRFIFLFIIVYVLLKSVMAIVASVRNQLKRENYRRERQQQQRHRTEQCREPDTQEDRIIEYRRKTFESTEVEDAEFIEIKEDK